MGKDNSNVGAFLLGAIIGGGAAAVTALLFAPKSGDELRKDLNKQAQLARDAALDYRDIAYQKGSAIYDTAVETAEDFVLILRKVPTPLKINWKKQVKILTITTTKRRTKLPKLTMKPVKK